MSPQKQAAQIANARLSHGPSTEAGKARSSQNSTRHGLCGKKHLIASEDRAEFIQHHNDMLAALAPEGAIESQLARGNRDRPTALDPRSRPRKPDLHPIPNNLRDKFLAGAETWIAHVKELALLTLYEQRINNRALTRNKAEFEAKEPPLKLSKPLNRSPKPSLRRPLWNPPVGSFIRGPRASAVLPTLGPRLPLYRRPKTSRAHPRRLAAPPDIAEIPLRLPALTQAITRSLPPAPAPDPQVDTPVFNPVYSRLSLHILRLSFRTTGLS